MEARVFPAEGGPTYRSASESRLVAQSITRADLERASFIAELVLRGVTSAEDTVGVADQAILHGLIATSNGDLASATHLLARGLIAAALSTWQFNELAADGMVRRDFVAAQTRRGAAELQLSLLPGRARMAAATLRSTPEGAASIPQLRSTLLAFVVGSGIVRSLIAVTAQQPWLRTLAASFDADGVGAADNSVRNYGVPRLSLATSGPEARRGGNTTEGRPALSTREREVLCQIVSGKTTSEIAVQLGVKCTTISTLVGRIFNKLGVNNRPAAVAVALRFGLCAPLEDGHA
jgi:DNA-binding CsgD family transcriptional regulator